MHRRAPPEPRAGHPAPRVYVVLVNWNGWKDTAECLESVLRSEYPDFVAVVVDNASSDDSVERLRDWAAGRVPAPHASSAPLRALTVPPVPKPVAWLECSSDELDAAAAAGVPGRLAADARVVLVRSRRNAGFGAGNNVAFRLVRLRGDAGLVWVLNNDTVATPGAMAELARASEDAGAIVGGTLRYYHAPHRVQVYGGGRLSRATGLLRTETRRLPDRIDCVNGASFMIPAPALEAVGGFDERIFLYFEENDLCLRAAGRGIPCVPSAAIVYHKHGAASAKVDDAFGWRQVLQNKTYVLRKNWGLGPWFPVHLAGLLASALGVRASPGKRRAARAILAAWARDPRRIFRPT